jgi:transposase
MLLEPMVDAVPPVKGPRGRPGRPRKRPAKLHGDKGYDYPRCRRALRRRGITPRIARRGIESSQRLGRHRYVVERSLAWLVGYRRLQVRYERRADILLGFVHLACALICLKSLDGPKAAPSSASPGPHRRRPALLRQPDAEDLGVAEPRETQPLYLCLRLFHGGELTAGDGDEQVERVRGELGVGAVHGRREPLGPQRLRLLPGARPGILSSVGSRLRVEDSALRSRADR